MKLAEKVKVERDRIIKIVEANNTLYPRVIQNGWDGYPLEETYLEIVVDRTATFVPDDIAVIQQQLEQLLGFPVYVITPNLLPDEQRESILNKAQVI